MAAEDVISSPQGAGGEKGVHEKPLIANGLDMEAQVKPGDLDLLEARIAELGTARPECFKSIWAEIGFVFSIIMSNVLAETIISGFTVLVPTVVEDLEMSSKSATWPAMLPSLAVAALLLPFGRISDMYGGYPVYVGGMLWVAVWLLVAGFAPNEILLNIARAMQGVGASAFYASGLMIFGSIYRPGPRKNVVFSLYGACASFGLFVGIFLSGIMTQFVNWRWFFWAASMLAAFVTATSYICIPSDMAEKRQTRHRYQMDWWGFGLIGVGFVLLVFSITNSSHAPNRWANPYIIVTLVVGVGLLIIAIPVEARYATQPLLPPSLLRIPSMAALLLALFFSYGSLGIYLLYTTFYMQLVMGASPLQVAAWYLPFALGGMIIGSCGGFVLHRIPGTILIILAGVCWIMAPLIIAIMPLGASYWAYVFPSMLLATLGIDITYNVANVFITTSLPQSEQGLAGAVANLMVSAGISFCLGFSDVVYAYVTDVKSNRQGFKAALWFEVACASVSLCVLILGVKIKKAESELTLDERAALVNNMSTEVFKVPRGDHSHSFSTTRAPSFSHEKMPQDKGTEDKAAQDGMVSSTLDTPRNDSFSKAVERAV